MNSISVKIKIFSDVSGGNGIELSNSCFVGLISEIAFLLMLPSAKFMSGWFSPDPHIIHLSAVYLIIAVTGHAGIYLSMWMSQLLNVIGKPLPVMGINLSRVFLFVIPLCMLGSRLAGFTGLVAGIALGNLLSGTLAYWTTRRVLRSSSEEQSTRIAVRGLNKR